MYTLQFENTIDTRYHKLGVFLAILVFIRTKPCYLWSLEGTIRPICAMIIMVICLLNISKEKWTWYIFACFALAYIWATVFVDHTSIVTVFNFLGFACIPIINKDLITVTYKNYRLILVFFVGMSILNYILVTIGIDTGVAVIEPLNSLKDYKYILHPFLVTIQGGGGRFLSIFDEPGFIGTLSGLMLIAERLNLQKRGNLVFLVAGVLSLSFYFYIALIFGFLLFSDKLNHKWIYIGLFVAFIVATYNNEYLYETLWKRFEYDSAEGKFVGDNRNGNGVDRVYESIIGTPLFFTGLGTRMVEDILGGASLKLVIIKHGFIFVALNLLGYGLLSLRLIKSKLEWLFFFSFFLLTLYQRPGFYATYSIFLYTLLIYKFGESKDD